MLSSRPHLISSNRRLEIRLESSKPAKLVIDGQKTVEWGVRLLLWCRSLSSQRSLSTLTGTSLKRWTTNSGNSSLPATSTEKEQDFFLIGNPILVVKVVHVQVSMSLEMKDSPGQLVAALKPISDVGGNIIAVIHHHDPTSTSHTLNVQIVLALPEGRLDKLVALLKEQGVHIQRIGKERLLYKRTVILIGHLMHTDLSDTVDQIDSTGFAEVCEISMTSRQSTSARLHG